MACLSLFYSLNKDKDLISAEVVSCVSVRSKKQKNPRLAFSSCLLYVPINTFWSLSLCHLVFRFHLSAALLISKFAQLSLGKVNRLFTVMGAQHSSCPLTVWFVVLGRECTSGCRPGGSARGPSHRCLKTTRMKNLLRCLVCLFASLLQAGNMHHVTVMYCNLLS